MTLPTSSPSIRQALKLPAAITAALLVGFAITALVSAEPLRACLALLTGALPDIRYSASEGWQVHRLVRFGSVIEDAITLTFLGLAIAIPFRARQNTRFTEAATHDASRHQLPHVRVRPPRLWKARVAAVGEPNQLVGRRRRPAHPAHGHWIAGDGIERFCSRGCEGWICHQRHRLYCFGRPTAGG